MAQTENQEIVFKKRKPVWPWVLVGLLVVGVGVYFLFNSEGSNSEGSNDVEEDNKSMIGVKENNDKVVAYISFVSSDTNKMSLDHSYASKALTDLTNAVEAMAGEVQYDVKADISKARQLADEITKDPLLTTHADDIRSAADVLSTALQNMQTAKFPELAADASDLKSAAASINPDTLALDQRDNIKSFFSKAAGLLQKMN